MEKAYGRINVRKLKRRVFQFGEMRAGKEETEMWQGAYDNRKPCDTCILKVFNYDKCKFIRDAKPKHTGKPCMYVCDDYISEDDVRMYQEAYITLQNLLQRCAPGADELIRKRLFGRIVVVPFEVWHDYNKMKNAVEFSAWTRGEREMGASFCETCTHKEVCGKKLSVESASECKDYSPDKSVETIYPRTTFERKCPGCGKCFLRQTPDRKILAISLDDVLPIKCSCGKEDAVPYRVILAQAAIRREDRRSERSYLGLFVMGTLDNVPDDVFDKLYSDAYKDYFTHMVEFTSQTEEKYGVNLDEWM